MTTNGHSELAQIGVRLLDDAYLAWLTAEADCQRKLDVWRTASRGKLAGAYLAYRAALDREDAAATISSDSPNWPARAATRSWPMLGVDRLRRR